MKRILQLFLFILFSSNIHAQFNLIVNEFSQGNGGTKEFIELVVAGTRTCTDSTADIRNWVFDDQNGWYGGSGNGIAAGHYRFSSDANWQKVPYGSIILIYNNGDQNGNIPAGASDPTDANHDYVYILPINNSLLEQNTAAPSSPSSPTYIYPTSGYAPSGSWSSLGLANTGDAVIIVDPANLGVAHFSILFGLTAGAGFQTPTVTVGEVAGNKNCYLADDQYSNASSWIIGNAGSTDETPGAGNTAANIAWIQSMRVQANNVVPAATSVQPTCTVPTGTITITTPVGATYTYSIDGINFQPGNVFTGLAPNTYTITVETSGTCPVTTQVIIDPAPGSPAAPTSTIIQPTCTLPTGTITINSPVGAGYTYSIDGVNFQPGNVFAGLAPNTYTITVQVAGCSATGTETIDPPPGSPAIPTSTIIQPTCTSPTGTITINSPVGPGYTYSIDGINFQASPVFPGLSPNTYTITVQAGGCSNTSTATIDAGAGIPPTPTFTLIQPTCATPTGTISVATPVGAAYTYSIDGISFQTSPVFSGLIPNNYTVTVQQTAGCNSSAPAVINIVPNAPSAPVVSSPVNYCQDAASTALTATGTNLLWYTSSTGGAGDPSAPVPSTAIVGTITYYVSQTIGGCESIRSAIDVIVTNLTISPISGNTNLCVHGSSNTTLSNTTTGGVWSSSNPSVAVMDNSGNVTAIAAGSTTITYSVSTGGCNSSVNTIVTVADLDLSLSANPNPISEGATISLNTGSGSSYQVIAWLPSPAFPDQTALSQSVVVNNDGTYSAIGQSAEGCIDTAQVFITVIKKINDIFVPNVFTPNNDGKNDMLLIYGNAIKEIDFRIFNQWGEPIFETKDKNKGWDGRYKGVIQPVTVYIYVLKATMDDGSVISKKGSVTLIR